MITGIEGGKRMISNAERRFYLLGLHSAFFFFVGLVLNVSSVFTISTELLATGSLLTYFSVPIMFIAFESICFPDDYNRADTRYSATYYRIGFYIVAVGCALATFIMLMYILIYGRTAIKTQIFFWGLFLTLCFTIIGRCAQKKP